MCQVSSLELNVGAQAGQVTNFSMDSQAQIGHKKWSSLAKVGHLWPERQEAAAFEFQGERRRLVFMQGASSECALQEGQVPKRALRSAGPRPALLSPNLQESSGKKVRSEGPIVPRRERAGGTYTML